MALQNHVKDFIKARPRLYDLAQAAYQAIVRPADATRDFFDAFSKSHNRKVSFVQIGASDGLRWDPVRPFIVRDRWDGILVEPLPSVFQILRSNYRHVKHSKLVFVNAAVSSSNEALRLWTFSDDFLDGLTLEERVIYSQKSSSDKDHVLRWARLNQKPEESVTQVTVPCFTLGEIVKQYWNGGPIDLIVIDAEGCEASILHSIDFDVIRPDAIYFESHNLAAEKEELFAFLRQHDYELIELEGDTIALQKDWASRLRP